MVGRDVASPIMKSGKVDIFSLVTVNQQLHYKINILIKNRLRLILGLEAKILSSFLTLI
jgi:hypothetical protein